MSREDWQGGGEGKCAPPCHPSIRPSLLPVYLEHRLHRRLPLGARGNALCQRQQRRAEQRRRVVASVQHRKKLGRWWVGGKYLGQEG